jgi:two-component system invasion response regulator UvrY
VGLASVVIVDDSDAFRMSGAELLATDGRLSVVGQAGSAREALALVGDLRPDLVLMDVNMPGMSGTDATRLLRSRHPAVIVVLISSASLKELPPDLMDCGAHAYLRKQDLTPDALAALIGDSP